ncbi:LysR family transcriptional regulator [Rhodococcus sp. HNM0569]|uniref:LysR family transcriptional regulator n=1 Tax=Rhodococcus sp. HNM0569 TaxID=2716340 RepID=UPI00146AAEF6|nr:LysR family transcriptional regulator [Rhodococcus sp. HNM0569]NLU82005.1 LysR family transcriptional regulator [Rhodococcus sp. HNM0569]
MAATFDITPLRSLCAVAGTGGVHRAAQSLALTQSAVSQHLRRLEREAGTRLVTRNGRGIALTPDGEALLSHARAILAAHDAAVARFDTAQRDTVVIGAAQNSAAVILPMMMTSLRQRFPGTEVRFHLDRNATVRSLLDSGGIDVAVTTRVAPELAARTAGFRLRWLWSANHPQPDPAEAMPIVAFSPPCTLRQPSFDAFSGSPGGWRVAAEVNDLATGLEAARAGVGAMLVPVLDRAPDGLVGLAASPVPPAVQLGVAYTDRTAAGVREAVTQVLGEYLGADRVEMLHNHSFPMPA